jgi:SAM-dependent methyltransferase
MDMIYETISNCRLCGEPSLDVILSLGDQPPANSLRLDVNERLEAVPLVICRCPRCTTVQLTETVSPQHLFRDYLWVTGTSQTARDYSKRFYENIVQRSADNPLFVVEVASNDGTFLQQFSREGHRVLGVDPALNLARIAEAAGVPTLADFFGQAIAKKVVEEHGHADAVIARNVLPHVPNPNDVVAGIAHCLSGAGVGAIEFHWIERIVTELHYDSIYHEHFFYHSLHSINALLLRHGLTLFDVTESPISGGSLVAYFSKQPRVATAALQENMAYESERGLATLEVWQTFGANSIGHKDRLKALVDAEIAAGRKLIGYGASARSSTLLNFCGINHTHLDCIADQSPHKHGRFTPGTDILIQTPEEALSRRPDTVLLLGWNFREEILGQMKELGFAGRVIVPLPGMPEVIDI